MKRIMVVFGTRPEAIKMAPLIKELQKHQDKLKVTIVVTAQHREMLDQVLSIFKIKPDYDLNIMKEKQTLTTITTKVLEGINDIIIKESPDMVLVHGDTSTTFVTSLASFYNQIPVGHVEAGLRTWNKYSPFPEEINRQMTGVISTLHFSPTETSKQNLLNEGKSEDTISVTGNTVIDALQTTVVKDYSHEILQKNHNKKIILVTAHRRENIGRNLISILNAIKRIVDEFKDVHVIFPVHLNPVIQKVSKEILGNHEQVDLIAPLDVIDFHNFIAQSYIILTDSGGIQEEAPSFGIPVLVLRDTTERPEGVEAGTLKLIGTDEDDVFENTKELLLNQAEYLKMSQSKNPYGDGNASKYITEEIIAYFKSKE